MWPGSELHQGLGASPYIYNEWAGALPARRSPLALLDAPSLGSRSSRLPRRKSGSARDSYLSRMRARPRGGCSSAWYPGVDLRVTQPLALLRAGRRRPPEAPPPGTIARAPPPRPRGSRNNRPRSIMARWANGAFQLKFRFLTKSRILCSNFGKSGSFSKSMWFLLFSMTKRAPGMLAARNLPSESGATESFSL